MLRDNEEHLWVDHAIGTWAINEAPSIEHRLAKRRDSNWVPRSVVITSGAPNREIHCVTKASATVEASMFRINCSASGQQVNRSILVNNHEQPLTSVSGSRMWTNRRVSTGIFSDMSSDLANSAWNAKAAPTDRFRQVRPIISGGYKTFCCELEWAMPWYMSKILLRRDLGTKVRSRQFAERNNTR